MALDPNVQHLDLMSKLVPADRMEKGGDLAAWQQEKRAQLENLLGMQHLIPAEDAHFTIDYVKELDNCTETRFLFESEPGVTVVAYLRVPKGVTGKLPVIICLQGHAKGVHISLGQPKYPGDEQTIYGGDRDFAVQIVSRGQAALAIEQRGFGERGGTPEGPQCYQPAVQAMLMGRTLLGERCWDISRTIDLLPEHFPQLDMDRIAVMGNSGGGTASIYAAALDTRIAACMPSCALCSFMPSIGAQYHCLCNYIPGIMNHFDMGDLAGLIAPRPFVAINGLTDGIFPIDSAKEQAQIAQEIYYAAAGAEDKLRHITGPAGHRFYAALGWPAFDELTGWKEN